MGFCKVVLMHCVSACERVGVVGSIVPLSSSSLHPSQPCIKPLSLNGTDPDDSSPSAWSCKLDIAALLQRRSVKIQTRFGSASPTDRHTHNETVGMTGMAGDLFCRSTCDFSRVKNKPVAQQQYFNLCFTEVQRLHQIVY